MELRKPVRSLGLVPFIYDRERRGKMGLQRDGEGFSLRQWSLKYHVRGGVRAAESTLVWRCQLGVISLEMVIEVRSTGDHACEISQSVMVFSPGGNCVLHGDTCDIETLLVVAVVMVVGYVLNFLQCIGEPHPQRIIQPTISIVQVVSNTDLERG